MEGQSHDISPHPKHGQELGFDAHTLTHTPLKIASRNNTVTKYAWGGERKPPTLAIENGRPQADGEIDPQPR